MKVKQLTNLNIARQQVLTALVGIIGADKGEKMLAIENKMPYYVAENAQTCDEILPVIKLDRNNAGELEIDSSTPRFVDRDDLETQEEAICAVAPLVIGNIGLVCTTVEAGRLLQIIAKSGVCVLIKNVIMEENGVSEMPEKVQYSGLQRALKNHLVTRVLNVLFRNKRDIFTNPADLFFKKMLQDDPSLEQSFYNAMVGLYGEIGKLINKYDEPFNSKTSQDMRAKAVFAAFDEISELQSGVALSAREEKACEQISEALNYRRNAVKSMKERGKVL